MSNEVNLKLEKNLMIEVKTIAQGKWPLRNISNYTQATREALLDFVEKNKRYINNKKSVKINAED